MLGTIGLPVIAPALVVFDLVRLRRQLPALRVYLFVLQYMINDSVEIVAAPVYWVLAGFGKRLDGSRSIARHERLQWWSLSVLERRAGQLLGLRLAVDTESVANEVEPGPTIVISRHVSLFDASLPGIVCERAGLRARGIIMAELLVDPGFDLFYRRSGSIFIPRDDAPTALAAIENMTARNTVDAHRTAYILFPEGRLFTPTARDRALARLRDRDPVRAQRLDGLTNLLPPRVAGLRTLLEALPEADVVLLRHRGLERLGGMAALVSAVPIDRPIEVSAQRIDRREIPIRASDFAAWLDALWLDLDAELSEHAEKRRSG